MNKLFAFVNMKRAKLCFISLFTFTISLFTNVSAQIAINNTAANPDASAILDLNTGNSGINKGFLAPQVALTNVTVAAPVTSPATGLMVYTTTAPTGGNGIGYYYWTGSKWDGLGTSPALLNLTQGTGISSFTYNGTSAATVGLANTGVTAGSYGSATTVPTYTVNAQGQITGAANVAITSSSGTVTNFSSGNLAPLFTTSVATSTTTPALTYSLSKAAAYTLLGNNTNASAVPTYFTPVLASNLFQNQGTTYSVLHGNGSGNPSWSSVDLTSDVTNNLPVTNLNSGAGANAGTFWRGDGTWATPAGGSISGSGTNGYLALWTPNSTTLGTSVVQDDGTEVGIGIAPQSGYVLSVNSTNGTAIQGITTNGIGGYFWDGYSEDAILASNTSGVGISTNGSTYGGYFVGGGGDYAQCADGVDNYGVNAYGLSAGGHFTDGGTEYAYLADATNKYGINAYGTSAGGYFADPGGDYSYIGYTGYGIVSYSATGTAGFFLDGAGDGAFVASATLGEGINTLGNNYGGVFNASSGEYGNIGDAVNGAGGTFMNSTATTYMYICQGGSGYITNGSKSTEVKDKNNNERLLFCNESPEVMFEDYGEGQLVNGTAHIALDSLFAMNVAISDKHPLRVYIELLGDCNGTYVTNRSANGFDVIELNHGTSNTAFQWHIICNRANEAGTDRDYAEKRFPVGPGAPKKPEIAMQKGPGVSKPVPPVKPTQSAPPVKKAAN